MAYSRSKLEEVVVGTLLNDFGHDGFLRSCGMSLRRELFEGRQSSFVFGILESMYRDGLNSTTPLDVFKYANEKGIKYGDATRFASYMCMLATDNYAFVGFKKYVKELVMTFLKERKSNGK